MKRRGYTLVEATVFSAVALIVLTGVWSFFQAGMRQSKDTDVKVQGLQEVLLAARTIEKDLAHLYQDRLVGMKQGRNEDGMYLRFYRFHPDPARRAGSGWGPLPLQKIEYRYKSRYRKLYRYVDGSEGPPLFGTFESVDFWDMMREDDDLPERKLRPGPSIGFHLVSTPRSELRKKREDRDWRSRTTLFGGAVQEHSSATVRFPYWHRVPFFPETPEED